MKKYAIVIDVEKCTGCYSCFLACKDEYIGNDYPPISAAQPGKGHSWMSVKEIEQGTDRKLKVDYIPLMCQHCADMPCARMAPPGAVYRRDDGIVIIDPQKAKNDKSIVNNCPYRVVYWNDKEQLPQKCTMCAHMLDAGEKTVRCVECCPTGAMIFGDLNDPKSAIAKFIAEKGEKIEVYKPEFGAKPAIKYLNLPNLFVAGEVVLADKKDECAEGARVLLKDVGGKIITETKTNMFGDFEFKDLEKNHNYVVEAQFAGYQGKDVGIRVFASLNLGEITLEAK